MTYVLKDARPAPRRIERRAGTIEVYFLDRDGRRWRIYEHSVMAGRRIVKDVGYGNADYRTFVPEDGGNPRQYLFFRDSPMGGRSLSPSTLQKQLDEGDEIKPRLMRPARR